ncbi:Cytosine deaminase [Madurella mycetomatis]|uniref:Cytosine deaminase n=1 Tax=Madurella mycetomatis TaxID=100816 RepID=A0A175VRJ4_9PEZI|nr:Cytosine deaminase [Madurella mycetomatis]
MSDLANVVPQHSPAAVLSAILKMIDDRLIPITRDSFTKGGAPFGGAVINGSNLEAVAVSVNDWRECPIYHGETNCIRHFYQLPPEKRPEPKTCVFFASHEPCSLCLSGFAWTGFPLIYYLFTYEETDELLGVSGDIEIIQEVFRVRAPGDTDETLAARPLYNKQNKYFSVRSIDELIEQVKDGEEREKFKQKFQAVRDTYEEFRPPRS